ncbi:uncharacterized protein LOC118744644 [Rhagoletis pomonella]|uniref:uncharacterized protein LOC118744644 n=1 Tax=Rhagoletis pomonella TaxID=28610 RepID=UPI001782AADA|nr:uncharacterized protein LOC118744644 [Rhagoletis pomonella]
MANGKAKKAGKGKGHRDGNLQKTEKEYKLLTMEEQQARDTKYEMRLVELRACRNFIDEAFMRVDELKEAEDLMEKWKTYLRCDGLPKPYIPPEVRLFFVKLRHFEGLNMEKTIDWQLSVDEGSILTQDIFSKNMTRKALVNELRPNFGDEYKEIIDLLLKIIKSIEYYTDDELKMVKARKSILEDVLQQKKAAYYEIDKFFDHYAYRILSSEDSYMDSVNANTAEYVYESENFCMHLWTLKNVPINFQFLETPCIDACLHKLKIKIQLPLSILQENLTIRGIQLFFDPFSENARSYRQDFKEIRDLTAVLSAGTPDIHDCLVQEHFMQVELQNQVRKRLMEKRAEYENKVVALAEQLENLKKSNASDNENKKKQPKLIKVPKEPPVITDDMFPDIWDDFLQLDNERYNNFIDFVYHPDSLRLEPDEINLKKYAILGGIYQLYFVKKPTHYNFDDFNMTWHENNGELQIIKNVIAEAVLPSLSNRGSLSRSSISIRRSLSRHNSLQPNSSFIDPPKYYETPSFVISMELPDYLCLWGEPLLCHFEDDLIGYVEETVSTPEQNLAPTPSAATDEQSKLFIKETASTGTSSIEIAHTPRQSVSSISIRMRRSISNVFRPSLASLTSMSQQHGQPAQTRNFVEVEDFVLDLPLSIVQIRNIQRHCLPRIISSFKFPVELQDEAAEEQSGKPKGKGGVLLRKRPSEEDVDDVKEFQYDGQNNPERMFPVFVSPETLHMEYRIRDENADTAVPTGTKFPTSFSQLVQTLDRIRSAYQTGFRRTLQVTDKKINANVYKTRRKIATTTRSVDSSATVLPLTGRLSAHIAVAKRKTSKRKTIRLSELDMAKAGGQKEREKEHLRLEHETQALLMRKQLSAVQAANQAEEQEEKSELEDVKESLPGPEVEDKRKTFRYSHWTTKFIEKTKYDKTNHKITIWTDRLGTIGLAYKLYEHFPFKDWKVEPDLENEGEVVFTLETQYVKCVINISANGYRGYVAEPTKGFVRNRKIYLDIKEPVTDLKDLKGRFRERFLNIFSNHDARFYIENSYFSEKHLACELHIYSCIALHCLLLTFTRSNWNRLAQRRDIVLNFAHHREPPENMMQVRITPENATFVDVQELCSDDLNTFLLDYTLTWRNIGQYSDFHHLIMSTYLTAMDNRCKDPKLLVNVKNLLSEIRPLSYS